MAGLPHSKKSRNITARAAAIFTLALSAMAVASGASLFQQDLQFTRAQTEISFWGRGNYHPTPATIQHTQRQLHTLLAQNANHPNYLALQASATIWSAYWSAPLGSPNAPSRDSKTPTQQAATTQTAVDTQYAALLSRPAHRFSWQKLAQYLSRSKATSANVGLAALADAKLAQLSGSPTR